MKMEILIMLIFKGHNAIVNYLKEDVFTILISLHRHMKSKLNDKDHVFYYNYKGTNKDYWGDGYKLLEKLVQLPIEKRKNIEYIVHNETNEGETYILYYYNKRSYQFELNRKYRELHGIMDRLQEVFQVEDEDKPLIKKWKYLKYVMT